MKRVSIIPNIITSLGLACGLFVIFKISMTDRFDFMLFKTMTLIILLAAFADVLDGAVARAVRGESDFGLNFDSLCDAISFGVAPSVLFLSSTKLDPRSVEAFCLIVVCLTYTICGVLRLVRYNVKQGADSDEKKKAFVGLPIPAAAVAFISPNLFFFDPIFVNNVSLSMEARGWILCVLGVFIAYLMLSRIRFASVKSFNFHLRSFQLVFFGSLFAIFFLYGLIYKLSILLLVVSWGYIGISLVSHFVYYRRLQRKKKK